MLEVIIVDDDDIMLFLQKRIVSGSGLCEDPLGYKVAAEALEYLRNIDQLEEKHYLIFLDVNMPGLNGWQFLDALQQLKRDSIYVIMATSSIDIEDREKASAYNNVIDFIEKPVTKANCEKIKELPEIQALLNVC